MTTLREAAKQAVEYMKSVGKMDMHPEEWAIVGRLEAALAEPVLQTCNCRWDGEVQVQQCTLHEAHVDAIHEWAERAKTAEKKLAALAEPVQEPVQQALCEADRIMGHDDEATEWRERWAHLFSCALVNGGYQCSCGANQRNAK